MRGRECRALHRTLITEKRYTQVVGLYGTADVAGATEDRHGEHLYASLARAPDARAVP